MIKTRIITEDGRDYINISDEEIAFEMETSTLFHLLEIVSGGDDTPMLDTIFGFYHQGWGYWIEENDD